MENLPIHIYGIFVCITLITAGALFYLLKMEKGNFNWKLGIPIAGWLALQAFLALSGFFITFKFFPPRFMFVITPALVYVSLRVIKGKKLPAARFIGYIHLIRIPLEIVLYSLAQENVIPEILTCRGRNFDVFAGIILPIVTYLYYEKKLITKNALLIFNLYGLASLINIVAYGVLSVPTPIQQFGFEHPNIAIFYFPFIWIPAFIVPSILFSHLVVLRELWLQRKIKIK